MLVLNNLRWHVARSVKNRRAFLSEELREVAETEIVPFMNVTCRHAEELTFECLKILPSGFTIHKLALTT